MNAVVNRFGSPTPKTRINTSAGCEETSELCRKISVGVPWLEDAGSTDSEETQPAVEVISIEVNNTATKVVPHESPMLPPAHPPCQLRRESSR
ncbi:unnamed protein product [Larinioides sclopetarius]|uniref:Uncharacterized protein n=1 Tax=Larinioides sclopetarius TaxID=280406 RepID=A0AAV2AMV6_9ARAC